MHRIDGVRVAMWRPSSLANRRGRYLPARGERSLWVKYSRVLVYFRWKAHVGYRLYVICDPTPPGYAVLETWWREGDDMAIRRRTPAGELPSIPALGAETMLFKKHPLLLEFLTATAYEDGSPRTPGYYTMRNRTIEFELTLYDPDGGCRVAIRAREHDKCFSGAEVILGASEAPWEPDRYLLEQVSKKPKKKK